MENNNFESFNLEDSATRERLVTKLSDVRTKLEEITAKTPRGPVEEWADGVDYPKLADEVIAELKELDKELVKIKDSTSENDTEIAKNIHDLKIEIEIRISEANEGWN